MKVMSSEFGRPTKIGIPGSNKPCCLHMNRKIVMFLACLGMLLSRIKRCAILSFVLMLTEAIFVLMMQQFLVFICIVNMWNSKRDVYYPAEDVVAVFVTGL